jgi:uncharacterized protein
MQCPACHSELRMAERQGIEIDYCPQCRGIWLDRGELDTVIERATVDRFEARQDTYERRVPYDKRWDEDDDERHRYKGRRRKSFLEELFDFD